MTGFCGWFDVETSADATEPLRRAVAQGSIDEASAVIEHWTKASGLCLEPSSVTRIVQNSDTLVLSSDGSEFLEAGSRHDASRQLVEVLSAAESQDVGATVSELTGPFAMAFIDPGRRRVILAVDRFGIRTLYYAQTSNGGVVFGTSAESVRQHPALSERLDRQALFDYVYFHVIPSPRTVYRDIRKLPPAHFLCVDAGQIVERAYWSPEFMDGNGAHPRELARELKDRLWKAVENCYRGPDTGTFLSGGIDSSTISGITQDISDSPVQGFTMGFESAGYDEMAYARIAASHFGLNLNEYYVTPQDVADAIPTVARFCDEPFGNSSVVPAYLCARLAKRRGISTLLAGDGGDELFAGNTRYVKQKVFDLYDHVPAGLQRLSRLLLESPLGNLPLISKARSYVRQAVIPMPDRLETYNYLHRFGTDRLFEPDFLKQVDIDAPISHLRHIYNQARSTSMLNQTLFLDWRITLADNDLVKVNTACELAGVRVAYPMLDDALVAFSTRVPPSLKLRGFQLRYFFKKAMSDFLPKEIISKPKHGFGLPFGEWLKISPDLQGLVYARLHDLKHRGVIRPGFIDELIETHRRDHAAYYGTLVWVLAMLEVWLQEHGVSIE